ncbi:ATP-binding protein [Variovorax ginsengisoli]|uniref:histidine kinase n=1 Tax=Variovorax ginsengisoli TaxID=363844 RepID=A0ABT9S3V3_9BURK|nr:ATP-binding protein [Variovorax ginsengisoli]MDP9899023.1 signal transduction histidine kinase/CheY-like chemotaxis protein [Variovorax ginsengisoli]
MRAFNFSSRVLLVALAGIVPFAVLSGVALYGLIAEQRAQSLASTLGVARTVATAIDGELRMTVSSLQAITLASPASGESLASLANTHALASAMRASQPNWRNILMAAPDGSGIFSTERPFGVPIERAVDMDSLALTVRTGQPVVGSLTLRPGGRLSFPVRVPILRDGSVRRVLTAVVAPEAISAVLARQQIPEGWTVSVFDSMRTGVARSRNETNFRGQPPSAAVSALIDTMSSREDLLSSAENPDGVQVQTALVRMTSAPWVVVIGGATSTANATLVRTLLLSGAGLVLSLFLSGFAAWWTSRTITRPIRQLRDSAAALGRGAVVTVQRSGIVEIDAVASALGLAGIERTRREAERDDLLLAERQARSDAQAAERRIGYLMHASSMLSKSLEESSTLHAIADVLVPEFADACRIDLLDENDELQRKLTRHFNPRRSAEIQHEVNSRHKAPPDVPGFFPHAVATGEVFLQNFSKADLSDIEDATFRDFARAMRMTALCVVPLVARGRTIGAMAVIQAESKRRFTADDRILIGEIAQRVALALDNVRLFAQARSAQQQAELASQSKDEFLAMLGHELRNPLAPIALALEVITRRGDAAFPRERQIIERQVGHLTHIVDDLLDVARVLSGKFVLKMEPVDMREVVSRALELTRLTLQSRARKPVLSLPSSPVMVQGDEVRLAQIVSALLDNAAKFTEPWQAITVKLEVHAHEAELVVADTGIGIAHDLLAHVFDRFVQGEQHLQRAGGGLGLGLSIAQSLVQLHGGSIRAESAGPGEGAVFTVRIPLANTEVRKALPAAPTPGPVPSTAPLTAPLRLLLVDDNKDLVALLGDWFRLEGHAVRTAHSAEEALALLYQAPADAAIFDIGLPGISGYELARRMRANERWRSMVLIALTGYGQETDRQEALAAGFDAHFPKPAAVEAMAAELQRLVNRTTT